jgi:diphosphomevalonate decarboxylase
LTRAEAARALLGGRGRVPVREAGHAFAPVNIALVKYWGKRDDALNLPVTDSLSIALAGIGTRTTVSRHEGPDRVTLNGEPLAADTAFAQRLSRYLDLVRAHPRAGYQVDTRNDVPTGAGLASSASGFAALTRALDQLHGWNLAPSALSILARLGSGSAARSVADGFVRWRAGTRDDGMDSYGEPLAARLEDLRIGLLTVSADEKALGSTPAMARTRATSPLYAAWPGLVESDLRQADAAIAAGDFHALGRVAEANALAMHATCIAARPAVLFLLPASLAAMQAVWRLRAEGMPVYFTIDAGPNLKLLTLAQNVAALGTAIPGLRIVAPFA